MTEYIELEDGTVIEVYARIHEGIPDGYMPYKPTVVADPLGFTKHASHDQSSHGNWARGGRSVNRDIAHRTLEEGGSTTRENKAVKKGKALSVYPERSRSYPNAIKLNETALTAAIADYRNDNKDLLNGRGNAIGTWLDQETGTLWLDVITVVSTEGEADRLARAHNQIAYFDIDTGQEVRTGGTGIAKRVVSRVRGWLHPGGGGSAPGQDDGLGGGCVGCGDRSEPAVLDPFGLTKHAGPGNHPSGSPQRVHSGGGRSGEDAFETDQLHEAIDLLGAGKHIRLSDYKRASILVDELRHIVAEAQAKGEKAPNFDLCRVHVKGSNMFCAKNKGVPRAQMPQLKGEPTAGTKADRLPRDERGEVSLNDMFESYLRDTKGVRVEAMDVPAALMKATQTELNGAKVAGIAQAFREGKLADERLFVTNDGYIVDGHHRWAAMLGVDMEDNDRGDVPMKVNVIDMDILEVLDEANKFAEEWGIPQAGFSAGFAKRVHLYNLVRKYDPNQPRDDRGRWTAGPGGGTAVGERLAPHYMQPYETKTGRGGAPENFDATRMSAMPEEFREDMERRFAEVGIEPIPDDLVENLDNLMERIKRDHPELVDLGKQWYADAQDRINDHALESGVPLDDAIAMTAAMSPNSEWGQNIALSGEMMRQLAANEPIVPTDADMEWLGKKAKGKKAAQYAAMYERLKNGETPRLSELPDLEAAVGVQLVGRRRELVSENPTLKGTYGRVSFATGTTNMAKAIAIYRGADPDDVLGGHKVRSFYNNLSDPFDSRGVGDVTIDTHAASAAQLFRMPMTSKRADQTVWTGSSTASNQQGAYPVYADAFRIVAARHNMAPNQAQAVLWVGWQQVRHEYPGIVVSEDANTIASGVLQRDVYGPARASTIGRYTVQAGDYHIDSEPPPRYKSQVSAWKKYQDGLISASEYRAILERTP